MINNNFKYFVLVLLFICFFFFLSSWENKNKNIQKISIENTKKENINKEKKNEKSKLITLETTLLYVKLDPFGGDIKYLVLKKYFDDSSKKNNLIMFDDSDSKYHFAQSGFLFKNNKNNKNNNNFFYKSNYSNYYIDDGESDIYVNLKYSNKNFKINKIYVFKNYSYEINIKIYLQNKKDKIISGKFYSFIKNKKREVKNNFNRSYLGFSTKTQNKQYEKIADNDIKNKNHYITSYPWIANIDSYFLSVFFINSENKFYINFKKEDNLYTANCLDYEFFNVTPNELKFNDMILFVGPKKKNYLNKISNGIDLSIDYGLFWPIATPIFNMLNKLFNIFNNWGISIILVTFLIRLLFFQLSSVSYKSIANMKKIQPEIDILKNRYKDDKKMFSYSIMNLYRKEKINPLSGCLPIFIQIPVFISLYYVLLESVEIRHSPFFFWILDLSSKDPFYILPLLMCLTMYIQQKMNPPIQDPLQAKIIFFMPFFFLFLFSSFPSGLILYWVVNNILSIFQQFLILKSTKNVLL